MDQQTSAHITSNGGNRWSSLRIDVQAWILATSFAFIAMFMTDPHRTTVQLAMTAVGLQMAIDITRQIDFAIRWSANFEINMLPVQRLLEYAKLSPEALDRSIASIATEEEFKGEINFDQVQMKYKPNLPPALRDLIFTVRAGERIAVVGRTGAGKSSLYQLLLGFRVADKGKVSLDRHDVSKLKLETLRSQINVVLQHPFVVATDTIRQNLDPRGEFSDAELEQVLRDAAFEDQQLQAQGVDDAPNGNKEVNLNSLASDLSSGQ